MQVDGQRDERHVEGRQFARKPSGQVDIRNRAARRPKALGELCERTAGPVCHEDQGFARNHARRDSCSTIGASDEPLGPIPVEGLCRPALNP